MECTSEQAIECVAGAGKHEEDDCDCHVAIEHVDDDEWNEYEPK
jgi:hypothetical protein